ncbi:GrpB family protein [Bacillus mesophilum]|uniref:GrpB family protein n=1 Tax=Bacillus mesophilum TaxID=1071718 RepID=A0A7V7RM23_9BACI|nr:GrpB family protein [Bacillus mesophilum]KAB2332954.1 GrpB family protein [Bacillus mesophilum]
MQLGLKREEIRLADYNPEWTKEFSRVRVHLLQNIQMNENWIQHIGSTAIKGMPAKPILDILVGVNDLNNVNSSLFTGLKNCGFLRLKVERPGEIVFAKFTDQTYEVKTHYLHLTEYRSELWNNLIFFRDYLNSNETARKRYLKIKKEYLEKSSSGMNEYTDYKEKFVKYIYNKRTSQN